MTFLFEILRLGLQNLRLHVLRSVLTALGIILGVAAVITMVSIGEGSKQAALDQIERLGARNIILRSSRPAQTDNPQSGNRRSWTVSYGLERSTLQAIREQFADAPTIVPLKSVGSEVLRAEARQVSQAFGTTPEFLRVAGLNVARGRFLTDEDIDQRMAVAVLGSETARALFPLDDPMGQTLRIDQQVFVIIGIMQPVGLAGGAGSALVGRDLNKDVYIPVTTARDRFNDLVVRRSSGSFTAEEIEISEIYYEAPTRGRVMADAARLERLLTVLHPGLRDVEIVVPVELLEAAERTALQTNILLGAIAGISLLVGGIGIMNIMLASVTERTREIGIRRALGATRDHIVWQFVVETGVLSALGGIIGVALGIGMTFLIGWGAPKIADFLRSDAEISTALTSWSIVLSFGVATLTGLIFGIYPAIVAARQDPIVALRHD
ncbi:MAG: ABC transporter permease [Planctomycetota bacterium]